jgi:iron complex transport system ATP-binding protein
VLKEDALKLVYHCDVRVLTEPGYGTITVLPAPRLAPDRPGRGVRVHVIAGGGCGEEVLRRLCLSDYVVTCGVLNHGDSDADVAAALDIETVLEKPFSPVGEAAIESARRMVQKADAVVVCAVPFGPGNMANLRLAEEALANYKPVFFAPGIADRDYTADRSAAAAEEKLASGGAVAWQAITDLLALLPRDRHNDAEHTG